MKMHLQSVNFVPKKKTNVWLAICQIVLGHINNFFDILCDPG